jgi:hypothetical protein
VDFQAEHAKAGIVQAAPDNFKGSQLLGHEEDRLSPGEGGGNEVRDGSGPERPVLVRAHQWGILRRV